MFPIEKAVEKAGAALATMIFGLSLAASAHPESMPKESMKDMPRIKETRIYQVTGHEDFDSVAGFGDDDGTVGMQYLMMTEGSGLEKMDMSGPAKK